MHKMIQVGVAYATSIEQAWHEVKVPEGTTIMEAITTSRILDQFPDINLDHQKVGVFGELMSLDAVVKDGDRVEIYRSIIIDPEKLERKKYRLRKMDVVIAKTGAVQGNPKD